jgi:hypothetical protein
MKILGIISVGFDVRDQLLARIFAFARFWRKKWEYNEQYLSYSWILGRHIIHLEGKHCAVFS